MYGAVFTWESPTRCAGPIIRLGTAFITKNGQRTISESSQGYDKLVKFLRDNPAEREIVIKWDR